MTAARTLGGSPCQERTTEANSGSATLGSASGCASAPDPLPKPHTGQGLQPNSIRLLISGF
jgi:hypothetical protein